MHMIVEHLVSLGRTRIGYYGPVHDSNHIDRFQGFRDAMEAAGLTWDPSAMKSAIRPGEDWEDERLKSGLSILLRKAAMLDAIIAPSDYFAAWTVEKLRESGFRVPEDIAVVGFNDVPDAAHAAGGITTIRQPFSQIARTAVDRLVAMIDGAPVSECRITLPTELIVRASTVGQRG
jgi:DNA-binding LacI/PurR family transcriptional regulator